MHQKKFPAEIEFLYEMLDFIKKYVEKTDVSVYITDQITLAVEEALVNIISYAYPGEKRGMIEIICENSTLQPGIQITIKDQGIPFNPVEDLSLTPVPLSSENFNAAENSLGGYGITILIGLMDRVEYQRLCDGNILVLTKYFGLAQE